LFQSFFLSFSYWAEANVYELFFWGPIRAPRVDLAKDPLPKSREGPLRAYVPTLPSTALQSK